MFRFDENLFDFYKLVKEDGELSWCAIGPAACCARRPSSRT
jgi:hypothetical protein